MTKSRTRKLADVMGSTFGSSIEDGSLDTSELTNNAGFITIAEVPVVSTTEIIEGDTSVTVVDNGADGKVLVKIDNVNVAEFNDNHMIVPKGTTAERDPSAVVGTLRYNTTIGFFESYIESGWVVIATPPVVTSITPDNFTGELGSTFTVIGSFFDADASVVFIGLDGTEYAAATVTFVSSTELSITNATNLPVDNEPYRLKITNGAGLSVVSIPTIDAGSAPAFTTTAGNIATETWGDPVSVTVVATDAESTITGYSITQGNLPAGITLNGTTGAITGTSAEQATTTYTFTITATDTAGNTNTRQFNIQIVNAAPVWSSPAEGSTENFILNTPNSLSLSASDPEGQSVVYSSGSLPAGLSISGSTLSGTPTVVANTSVSVNASDGYASSVRNFFINVIDGLYVFDTFTFTSGGITGRTGPTLTQLKAAYDTTANPWLDDSNFFGSIGGYQFWTVPTTADYDFIVEGGYGGHDTDAGRSAIVGARISLVKGDILSMIVGQSGLPLVTNGTAAGGGGGTFVTKDNGTGIANNTTLLVAGGGGGADGGPGGGDAQQGTSGGVDGNNNTTPATNGAGGSGINGGGGGGLIGNGGQGGASGGGGFSFVNGGTGGFGVMDGGFGGGGGSAGSSSGGGGGGGYSGGQGGNGSGTAPDTGGGGSFYISSSTNNTFALSPFIAGTVADPSPASGKIIITKV